MNVNTRNSIKNIATQDKMWYEFLNYKINKQQLSIQEEKSILEFIEEKKFLSLCEKWSSNNFPENYPSKSYINKGSSGKKRVVYSFLDEEGIMLKFIAFQLYKYDNVFEENCYAFRRNYGVGDAIKRIRRDKNISQKYCLKSDISNYFNSIDIDRLIQKIDFLKNDDIEVYELFTKILTERIVIENGKLIEDNHGAMAGTPVSPFFANVYLSHMDRYFKEKNIQYFRYSDDILIFANTIDELEEYKNALTKIISTEKLTFNEQKMQITNPGEKWDFLGFSYENGDIDISENTLKKVKAKVKRKANALRRWQRKKGLDGEKAAKGFIKAINRMFFGREIESEFTWSRWFFPYITVDKSLHEIDKYVQMYIRYTVTGRHYKGNYKITYDKMKEWGYRSLVNEYYSNR